MGSGIAQKSATEGFSVQMVDREEQWVDKGKATIDKFLQEALERRIFRPEQAEGIKSRIRGVVGHENVSPETDLDRGRLRGLRAEEGDLLQLGQNMRGEYDSGYQHIIALR